MKSHYAYPSPVGTLWIEAEQGYITSISYREQQQGEKAETPLIRQAYSQLDEYFRGERKQFDLPLKPAGTPFQQQVWQALRKIPYGETRTYGEIAAAIGNPRACRAVGMANHCNPIAIVIPCHRVIGTNGSLTGYAGGFDIKQKLLELEGACEPALF